MTNLNLYIKLTTLHAQQANNYLGQALQVDFNPNINNALISAKNSLEACKQSIDLAGSDKVLKTDLKSTKSRLNTAITKIGRLLENFNTNHLADTRVLLTEVSSGLSKYLSVVVLAFMATGIARLWNQNNQA